MPLQDFSSVAEKTGTYTAFDYADIMEHLSKRWKLSERSDLTGEVRTHAAAALLQAGLRGCPQGNAHGVRACTCRKCTPTPPDLPRIC